MRFRFIDEHRPTFPGPDHVRGAGGFPSRLLRLARAAGERRATANRELLDKIRRVHGAAARATGARGCTPRSVPRASRPGGDRVAHLMRQHGLAARRSRRGRPRTTDSRHDLPIAPNLLQRQFTTSAPNRIWLADSTYIRTDEGWLYLAAVLDLFSRKIVGWAMADHLRGELTLAALRMAIARQRPRRPDRTLGPRVAVCCSRLPDGPG